MDHVRIYGAKQQNLEVQGSKNLIWDIRVTRIVRSFIKFEVFSGLAKVHLDAFQNDKIAQEIH